MNSSEYPPLPPKGGNGVPVQTSLHHAFNTTTLDQSQTRASGPMDSHHPRTDFSKDYPNLKVISGHGDIIIEYADLDQPYSSSRGSSHYWQVASEDLMQNSPYFRALLDPNKFSEGREIFSQKILRQSRKTAPEDRGQISDEDANLPYILPTVRLPADSFTRRLGLDAIELFLKILSFNSLEDEEQKIELCTELKFQPTSLVARLVEIADVFNSPNPVREILKKSAYAYGKGKTNFGRFDASFSKLSEDRIRQIIYISHFLDDQAVYQVLTHTLIVFGSRQWFNGVEAPTSVTLRWRYLSDGLEEELYFRRQCVLNTITDLQAHFLRAFGALEDLEEPQPSSSTPAVTFQTTTLRPRHLQCRFGFANSSACDAFHLGQMTRFFVLRTKTVFLGSTLIDPDFSLDPEEEDKDYNGDNVPDRSTGPPSDIIALLASLKQCPDYQIDTTHMSCGIRRRFLPPLDCIERFVGDGRGLLGIPLRLWNKGTPLSSISWANRTLRRAQTVDIHFSRISGIHYKTPGQARSSTQEEDARLFFTARKRNWES